MAILHDRKDFEDASGFKKVRVLIIARLHMQGLRRVPNIFVMAPCASVIPEYTSIYLNFP